ncbi:hypothetical protein C8Q78DRAFT_1080118 [Trametes maxima]|nr:hypothetical protein C8Q78DRAFT_1080118 [Trametes maxima]
MGGAGTDTVNITTSLSDAPGASADVPTDSKGAPADLVAEPSAPGEGELVWEPSASASTPAFPAGSGDIAPLNVSEQPVETPPVSSPAAVREGEEPSVGGPTSDSSKQSVSVTSTEANPLHEGAVPDVNPDKTAGAQGPEEQHGKQDAEGEPASKNDDAGVSNIPTTGAQDVPAEAGEVAADTTESKDATESKDTPETTGGASSQEDQNPPSDPKGDTGERAESTSDEQKPGVAPTDTSVGERVATTVKQEGSVKETSRHGNGAARPSQPASKASRQKSTKALGGKVLPPRPSELEEQGSAGVPGAFADTNPFSMRSPEKLESPSWWPF